MTLAHATKLQELLCCGILHRRQTVHSTNWPLNIRPLIRALHFGQSERDVIITVLAVLIQSYGMNGEIYI